MLMPILFGALIIGNIDHEDNWSLTPNLPKIVSSYETLIPKLGKFDKSLNFLDSCDYTLTNLNHWPYFPSEAQVWL